MGLSLSGLASGMDWKTIVEQLTQVERSPQTRMLNEQNTLQRINNAYSGIKTQLGILQNRLNTLKEPDLFDSRSTSVGDSTVASATSQPATPLGTYNFNFTQLASASNHRGAADVGAPLSATSDVSGVVVGDAGFSTGVTAGTFTVNGNLVTIETKDTLKQVFDKISAATSGAVTAAYNPTTDRITLSGSTPVVLGSAADTSNFLQVSRLYNNGTATVASSASLGSVKSTSALEKGNFATAISDGGSRAGAFKINGVSIAFDQTKDSLQNVLDRINTSEAGVTASYDVLNDRVVLSNKSTGDLGVSLSDVTGNFLAATGLLSGSLERGKNLTYTINGGDTLVSQSNTISQESSGIPGLSVTALKQGSTTSVTVAADTSTVRSAINGFITEYNRLQSMISTQTASSTNAQGKVTAGILANESDADTIARQLRSIVNGSVDSSVSSLRRLETLGITANGNDDTLSISDTDAFENALTENLSGIKGLFTNASAGIATKLNTYIESTIGDDGWLLKHQDKLTNQIADIDTQVADQERYVQTIKTSLTNSFLAMEQAQQKSNQQLQFLSARFGSTSSG